MNNTNDSDINNDTKKSIDTEELLHYLCPMIERLSPAYIESQKVNANIMKHQIYVQFLVLAGVVASVFYLSLQNVIVGSAAVVVFGSIAGYIFGKSS